MKGKVGRGKTDKKGKKKRKRKINFSILTLRQCSSSPAMIFVPCLPGQLKAFPSFCFLSMRLIRGSTGESLNEGILVCTFVNELCAEVEEMQN